MNKISLSLALAVAALGFSSCTETWDGNPVIKTHEGVETVDFLNTPVMQNQTIMLSQANKEGHFELTCSQPDFGYAALAAYYVQVSLKPDFSVYRELDQAFYDCAAINPLNGDVAAAIEYLSGVQTEDDLPLPYQKLYMRLHAFVPQDAENTQYLSNVVYFNQVAADYLAIWVAGVERNMYLRGGMNEWTADPAYQFATGAEENTFVTGVVDIAEGTEFKVADDSWGALNAGAGSAGHEVTPGVALTIDNGDNPGNLKMMDDFHGYALLTLDKGVYTLTMVPVQ